MTRGQLSSVVAHAMLLVRQDKQVAAIKTIQQSCNCGPFKARNAVDIIANRMAKTDPSVVPFRTPMSIKRVGRKAKSA